MKIEREKRGFYFWRMAGAVLKDIFTLGGIFDDPDPDGYRSAVRKEWVKVKTRREIIRTNRELQDFFNTWIK